MPFLGWGGGSASPEESKDQASQVYKKHYLDEDKLKSFFQKYPECYLLATFHGDYEKLAKNLDMPSRVLLETPGLDPYKEALKAGIKYPILGINSQGQLNSYMSRLKIKDVSIIAVSAELMPGSEKNIEKLLKRGVKVFSYGNDSEEFIKSHAGKRASAIYSTRTDYPTLN